MKKTIRSFALAILLSLFVGIFTTLAQTDGGVIQFGAGESSAWISGSLAPNESIRYSFYALSGQIVSISVKSANNSAIIGFSNSKDYFSYLSPDRKYMYYTMPLPQTGTYYLTVQDTGPGTDFVLQLTIPPLNQVPVQPVQSGQPVYSQPKSLSGGTIQFAEGQSSATISGWLDAGSDITYQFYASKNQVLSLAVTSTNGSVFAGIQDGTGYIYLSPEKRWQYFISPLYSTGPYYLTLFNPGGGTNFSFQITIPPLNQTGPSVPILPTTQPVPVMPYPISQNGGAIQFAPGETSTWISGNVSANNCIRYSFFGGNNYKMIATLNSATGSVSLGVSDIYGTVYLNSFNRSNYWMMPLKQTATYFLDVCNYGQQPADFTLNLVIPVNIPTSYAVKTGTLRSNSVVSYTIFGHADQVMTVNLNSGATPQAYLRIMGLGDGVVYLDNNAFQTYWSGTLPGDQDYLIDVVAFGAASNYQLSVSLE